jgi:hypothetical protein
MSEGPGYCSSNATWQPRRILDTARIILVDIIYDLLFSSSKKEPDRNEFGIMKMVQVRILFYSATVYRRNYAKHTLPAT